MTSISSRIIKDGDNTRPASDILIFSSKRTKSEIEKRRSNELRVWNGYIDIKNDGSVYTINGTITLGNMLLINSDTINSITGFYNNIGIKITSNFTSTDVKSIKLHFTYDAFQKFDSVSTGYYDTTVFINKALNSDYYDNSGTIETFDTNNTVMPSKIYIINRSVTGGDKDTNQVGTTTIEIQTVDEENDLFRVNDLSYRIWLSVRSERIKFIDGTDTI